MSNQKISTKKLRAIVFTDIVNFTQMSADDEQHAVDLIDKQNEILKPIVKKHNGEWLKEIGDGLLLSFDSSIEAVRCSIEIQETLKDVDELNIRIGIHQGDIILKDGDVFGDDVNIASRIESFAPVGGISMSDKVHKDISGVSDIKTSFIGHRKLKGVEQETKVRCISSHNLPKHNISRLPTIAAYICFFISIIFFTGAIIVGPLGLFTSGSYLNSTEMYEDLWMTIVSFVVALSYLLVGYSCLSFSKGLSLNSQKFLVYLAYIYVFIPFVLPIVKSQFTETVFIAEIIEYGPSMIFAFLFLLVGFPLMTITLFKFYYYFKKRSNWKIFKNDKIALLLYFLLFIIIPFIVMASTIIYNHRNIN